MIKNILKIFLAVNIILIFTSSIFAQSPPSPPAAPTIVPWGPTELYLIIIFGYVIRKLRSKAKDKLYITIIISLTSHFFSKIFSPVKPPLTENYICKKFLRRLTEADMIGKHSGSEIGFCQVFRLFKQNDLAQINLL